MDFISEVFVEKFIRYAIVGFIGVGVDFAITFGFKEYLKVSKYLANSLGFSTAVISNFLLNRYWTFGAGEENAFLQFGTFLLVSVMGLFINNFIIFVLNEKWNINFYFSKIVAIGVVVLWNFFVNYFYTFRGAV